MTFTIDNKEYKLNIAWNTVTLMDAVNVSKINIDSDKLKELLDNEGAICPDKEQYMVQALSFFSNCPYDVLNRTDVHSLVALFDIIRYMVRQLYDLNIEEYTPIGFSSIRHNGKRFHFPETIVIEDKPVLMYSEPCKNFIEATEVMKHMYEIRENGIEPMKYICAIYLKPEGEKVYNPKAMAERAKEFETLPMHIVWDVFFFTYWRLHSYMMCTVKRYSRIERKEATRIVNLASGLWLLLRAKWRERLSKWKG